MSRPMIKQIAIALCTTALMILFAGAFTQTARKREAPAATTVRDAVERIAINKLRAKEGFVLTKEGASGFIVKKKDTQVVIGKAKCGSCPGGTCTSTSNGKDGACEGCKDGRDCTIDPY